MIFTNTLVRLFKMFRNISPFEPKSLKRILRLPRYHGVSKGQGNQKMPTQEPKDVVLYSSLSLIFRQASSYRDRCLHSIDPSNSENHTM